MGPHWTGLLGHVADQPLASDDKTGDTIQLLFEDGSLAMPRVLLCAFSSLGDEFEDSDGVSCCEVSLASGLHLLDLMLRGQTGIMTSEAMESLQQLLVMLAFRPVLETVCLNNNLARGSPVMEAELITTNLPDGIMKLDETINVKAVPRITQKKKTKESKTLYYCDYVPCTFQNVPFTGLSSLRKHTTSAHNMKPLPCPEAGCQFRADDVTKLRHHMSGVHRGQYSDTVTCHICHKTFPSVHYLKTHVRRMHQTEETQRAKVCPHCGESKIQLADHIKRAHTIKKYFCDLCPKSFKTNVQRRIHQNVHTGFKPYTCATCDQRFARLHHRKIHLEKHNHSPGPVLKPPDYVDQRSVKRIPGESQAEQEEQIIIELTQDQGQDYLEQDLTFDPEQLKHEIGVNCADIIKNITLSSEHIEFEDTL